MNAIALIPARGGSKRLPRKNVVDFNGRPIIAHTIDAALQSRCFERVVVSTEDEEIARCAAHCGAAVDMRAQSLATDTATVLDVCMDFLEREAGAGREWPVLGCLYATAPFRDARDVQCTMALLKPGFCDFAMAVTSYDHAPQQALKVESDGTAVLMWPELVSGRGRELPRFCVGNGSTYGVNVQEFIRQRTFYGAGLNVYEMPRCRSIDINTQEDLNLARLLAQHLESSKATHVTAGPSG
jgi:pseudaminic acid cytidylyltransferase